MNKWRDRVLIWLCIVICLACWIAPKAWSVNYPVRFDIPDGTAYRVVIQKYAFGTLVSADTVFNCDSLNRTYSLGLDTNHMINLLVTANAGDSAYSIPFLAFYRFSSTPVTFRTPLFLDESADSIRATMIVNGAQTGTNLLTGPLFKLDSSYTFSVGQQYNVLYDVWFAGEDEPASNVWPYYADTVGGGGSVQTVGDVNYALVYGTIYGQDGNPIVGAVIEATRVSATNAALSTGTGTKIIVSPVTLATPTNTSGYFQMNLLRSNQYSSTGDMKYNIRGTYDGVEIFSLKNLTIPSTGNINVADTIAVRQ